MAIAALKKQWKANLNAAILNYNDYATSLGTNTLVEFLLMFDSLEKGCRKGTTLVAKPLESPDKEVLLGLNNKSSYWEIVIKRQLKKIYTDRKFGGKKIKNWQDWNRKGAIAKGLYFAQRHKNIKGDLKLLIWCNEGSEADDIVDLGVNKLILDLWKDFQKIINKDMDDPQMQERIFGSYIAADSITRQSQTPLRKKRGELGREVEVIKAFRQGALTKEHGWNSTTSKLAIERHNLNSKMSYQGSVKFIKLNVSQYLRYNVKADWNQIVKKQALGKFKASNILTLRLGKNEPLDTDVKQLVKKGGPVEKYIRREVLRAGTGTLYPTQEASHSLAKQMQEDVMKDIIAPLTDKRLAANRPRTKSGAFDMRFKANRGLKNLKSFKNRSRTENLSRGKKRVSKVKNKQVVVTGKVGQVAKKEKGKGEQASTSLAADLVRLKKEINRNLSAEVRRNMGKPALSYRTGRFANSVQLLSLVESQNTVMAKYTYLLRPYQTFENQGKYRWPMSYNPKTLIAKSLRNLAQGRIEQKLTVRRV